LAAPPHPVPEVPRLADLGLAGDRPLVIVDVDEVLGLFVQAFERYLRDEGVEFRFDRYALFQNMYWPDAAEPMAEREARALYDGFYRCCCGTMDPVPGAAEALATLGRRADVVILTNAPAEAAAARADWLLRHGMPQPLVLNRGLKGPMTAGLAAQTPHRAAFVDDIMPNLDSVSRHAPAVATFQTVADPRLRALAPTSPLHRRIDDWKDLAPAIEAALLG
jgi:hypothetical protein